MIDNKKVQLFLLMLCPVCLLFVLSLITYLFYFTRDARVFGLVVLATPLMGILRKIYSYYFPPSAHDYEIKKLKLVLWTKAIQLRLDRMKPADLALPKGLDDRGEMGIADSMSNTTN